MRVFTTVPQESLRLVPQAARAAEAERYDGIISMENKHDPFLALAVAGASTERIELHTGVAISFARTPMAVAQVGWDMAGSTGGRFVIGLGSQVRAHNERRFWHQAQIFLRHRCEHAHRFSPSAAYPLDRSHDIA